MLKAEGLAAQRGGVALFADVEFALNPGEALIVTGANGSGKTTLLRMVAGLTRPHSGQLYWQGVPVAAFDHSGCEAAGLRSRDGSRYLLQPTMASIAHRCLAP